MTTPKTARAAADRALPDGRGPYAGQTELDMHGFSIGVLHTPEGDPLFAVGDRVIGRVKDIREIIRLYDRSDAGGTLRERAARIDGRVTELTFDRSHLDEGEAETVTGGTSRTIPQDAAEHLARERDRPEAEEAYEEWLREAEPEPFTPEQRVWIVQRIERAIENARLNDGADSAADHFWPEVPAGEIDF